MRAAISACGLLSISVTAADLDQVCSDDCLEFIAFGPNPEVADFKECFAQRFKNSYAESKCKLASENTSNASILASACTWFTESIPPKGVSKGFKAVKFSCKSDSTSSREVGILYIVTQALRKENSRELAMEVQILHR